jgi:DNA-binding NtrC family response regulator
MEHAVVLLEPGSEIQSDDIPYLNESEESGVGSPSSGSIADHMAHYMEYEYHTAREQLLVQFELQYLSNLVQRAGANMSRAAKLAGVDRTTLYRLMEKHGLQRDTVIKVG